MTRFFPDEANGIAGWPKRPRATTGKAHTGCLMEMEVQGEEPTSGDSDAQEATRRRSRRGVWQMLAELTRSPDRRIKAAAENAAALDISPRSTKLLEQHNLHAR